MFPSLSQVDKVNELFTGKTVSFVSKTKVSITVRSVDKAKTSFGTILSGKTRVTDAPPNGAGLPRFLAVPLHHG